MSAAARSAWPIVVLSLALLLVRLATAAVIAQPGYTDAYYYGDVGSRLARGEGLSADFVWNFLEAPSFAGLPVPSHRFWQPLVSIVGALGIATLEPLLGTFRAAQAALLLVAAFIPLVAWRAARALGASDAGALVAAAIAGLGGLFAPGWVTLDAFAVAALLGTLFFLAYARAAAGSLAAGALAGGLVGVLYLARAEAALFGIALLALAARAPSRRAGVAGTAVALAIGLAWLARDVVLGLPGDLFARTALLVRYEDFFAIAPPTADAFAAALPQAVGTKMEALGTNAVTFAFSYLLVLAPFVLLGAWRLRQRPEVRAFAGLLFLVYLGQSVLWTLHSTRGSYFHSLAAFFPFGVALAVAGAPPVLRRLAAARVMTRFWIPVLAGGALVAAAEISIASVLQWDTDFNAGYRTRAAAVDAIPAGAFLAIDAAAWRWIAGRAVVVTPADGLAQAACAIAAYRASAVVLEEAHFSAYDALYRGASRPTWLGAPIERGEVRIYPVTGPVFCGGSR